MPSHASSRALSWHVGFADAWTHSGVIELARALPSGGTHSMRRRQYYSQTPLQPPIEPTCRPLRVFGKNLLDLDRGIATLRKQQLERLFAAPEQIANGFDRCGLCSVPFHCWAHRLLQGRRGCSPFPAMT